MTAAIATAPPATPVVQPTTTGGVNVVDAIALIRQTPALFARLASGNRWQFADHLQVLNRKLMDVAAGRCRRLIVMMPPRHGKSNFISQYFPAWYLGAYPDRRVIITSHTHSLAASWGEKARDTLAEFGPAVFGVTVASGSSARDEWSTARATTPNKSLDGGLLAAGVGGPLTGRGSHLLIIDDPHKNDVEARSETMRDRIGDWWKSTAYTRLAPDGAVVVVMTRWHQDDLAGRLLAERPDDGSGADEWEVLRLPAIAEADDPLGRPVGAPLWPERFGAARLDEIKREIGSYNFAALYQQRPQPAEGALFRREHFRQYTRMGDTYYLNPSGNAPKLVGVNACRRFTTVDLALSEKDTADWTVASTWDVTPTNDLLLIDVRRVRMEDGHEDMLERVYDDLKPSFIAIESVAFQARVVTQLRRRGKPVRSFRPDRDKVSRALVARTRYEGGSVYHPTAAQWLGDFEEELLGFPTSARHDDQVDTVSMAALIVAEGRLGGNVGGVNRPTGWQ